MACAFPDAAAMILLLLCTSIVSISALEDWWESTCDRFPGCAALDEAGQQNCCPQDDGQYNDCCYAPWPFSGHGEQCKAHQGCASEHATEGTETCCPTPEGSILDCCSTSLRETYRPIQSASRQCKEHGPCSELEGMCCPTDEDVVLECCLEPDENPEYWAETLVYGISGGSNALQGQGPTFEIPRDDTTEYWHSTGTFTPPYTGGGAKYPTLIFRYQRNPTMQYDLLYMKTGAIHDASDFVSGKKKFFLSLSYHYTGQSSYPGAPTVPPPCTPIYLQLDRALQPGGSGAYPKNRHSRYVTFLSSAAPPMDSSQQLLEFTFFDRPDPETPDDEIDSLAIFFDPGKLTGDTYSFTNLFIGSKGCSDQDDRACFKPTPKTCKAMYLGERDGCNDGVDNDGDDMIDCADPDCSQDEVCIEHIEISMMALENKLIYAEEESSSATLHGLLPPVLASSAAILLQLLS